MSEKFLALRIFVTLCYLFTKTIAFDYLDTEEVDLSRSEFIDAINAQATTWTAGPNPLPAVPYMLRELPNAPQLPLWDYLSETNAVAFNASGGDQLPESFDARDRWPECPSLRAIRDQGCCGSCYAVATASAMTDRWCIYSNGTRQFTFSAADIVSCCSGCGNCTEGSPAMVWVQWRDRGFVSGGEFGSEEGCKPYFVDGCSVGQDTQETPECREECRQGYSTSYQEDLRFARRAYHVPTDQIMLHMYHFGSVTTRFDIYSDFSTYQSGVYQLTVGRRRGAHIVKLIGWGVENGTKYWLAANSWGSQWGDRGFFKFLRGENHLGIEQEVFGGIPRYDD